MSNNIVINDINTIPNEYIPIIYGFNDDNKKDIGKQLIKPFIAQSISYPLMSLGFQQFLHAIIEDMGSIVKDFEKKKKVYAIIHQFNSTIDNYEQDLSTFSKTYLKTEINGNGFYKLWEIFSLFDINKLSKTLQILDNNGDCTQAVELFNKVLLGKGSGDYNIISSKESSELEKYVKSNKNAHLTQFDESKIFDDKILKKLSSYKNSMDVVIGYGSIDWKYDILIEQKNMNIFIFEIVSMISSLKKGGTFICRIFETYTNTMSKLLYALTQLFDESYFIKPLFSHLSTSEKFIVCKNYIPNTKLEEQLKSLFTMITQNSKHNVVDIFPELILPVVFKNKMISMNVDQSNKQILSISKIISFIKSQNYYGDVYNDSKQMQINSTTYWIDVFYPKKKELSKKVLSSIFEKSLKISNDYSKIISKNV